MGMIRRRFLAAAAGSAVLASVAHRPAYAQPFPAKPVKLIMAYPPGGGADQWARIIAARLETELGQPIVFDYRPGGSSTIAAEATARAPADGYTIHVIDSAAFAYVPNLRRVSYDPVASFTPLAYIGTVPMCIVATPSLPVRTIPELVAYAREQPGRIDCASAGIGSAHHLIAESFKMQAGIQMGHVPYKGATQYLADLAGGQVQLAVSTIGPAIPYAESDRIRVLGVTTARRASALSNVPTIAEQGYPEFDEAPWNCFVAPAGMPEEPRERLRAALRVTLADPQVGEDLRRAGLEAVGSMPVGQIAEAMSADLEKWGEVIRRAGISIGG